MPPPALPLQPKPPGLLQLDEHHHRASTSSPALPPKPAGILQDNSSTHLLSPRPQRPAGGAVDTKVAEGLQRAASSLAIQQQQANMGPSSGNVRVANWVAATSTSASPSASGGQYNLGQSQVYSSQQGQYTPNGYAQPQSQPSYPPYPAQPQQQQAPPPPRLSVNGNGYEAYHAQRQSAGYGQPQPMKHQHQQHPPRASSMYSSNADPSAVTLQHSFSDLSLAGPSNGRPHPRSSSYSTLDPTYASHSGPPAAQAANHLRHSTNGTVMPPVDHARRSSTVSTPQPSDSASSAAASTSSLCIALPTQSELGQQRSDAAYAANPSAARVSWAKAVLKFVERHQASASSGEFSKITDPVLVKWTDESIRLIISLADSSSGTPVPEALYLRGELSSSGKFPSYRSKDLGMAFRDFEAAANLGYHPAWAKIALAYETFGEQNNSAADYERAKKAYEEGVRRSEVTCTYRIAMAHLLGQLGYQPNPAMAIPLLKTAASLSTTDDPLPAYIYGMLLSGELDLSSASSSASGTPQVPPHLLLDHSGRSQDPRPWVERSAYLGYGPAQFKMGLNYEYATMGCGYDPLLSVQYYSLASQQGDIEADMALSKWFLCGSEAFDLQENLAFTFAEKAAKKGLPSAEFALGYYYEIGIGGRKDVDLSKQWYSIAAKHGNADAADRLAALRVSVENTMSRTQHEAQMNDKIVRRRTQAKVDADNRRTRPASSAAGAPPPPMPAMPDAYSTPNSNASLSASTSRPLPRPSASMPAGGFADPRLSMSSGPSQGQGQSVTPMPFPVPPHVVPTSESNSSLRRRETLRQVEQQAADYARRQSHASSGSNSGSPKPASRIAAGRASSLAAPPAGGVQRYSLVDTGPAAAAPAPSGAASAVSSNSSGASKASAVSMVKPAGETYQTFESMGLKTGRVKAEQECIIC